MNNLVPTRIMNKNGVATTVYKRPDAAASVTASIPAPAAPDSSKSTLTRSQLINEVGSIVYDLHKDEYGSDEDIYWDDKRGCHRLDTIEKALGEHDDDTLRRLEKALNSKGWDDLDGQGTLLADAVFEGRSTGYIKAIEHLHPLLRKGSGTSSVETLLGSLKYYHQQVFNLDGFDESLVPQMAAILRTVCTFEDNKPPAWEENTLLEYLPIDRASESNPPLIKSDALVKLLLRRPEQADQIARLALERGNPKAEDIPFIEELLDSEAPAISEGAL